MYEIKSKEDLCFEHLKPLQNKLLEILLYIDYFCKENNIAYSLAFGTALGARRHKGFIPWDDDVDVYMTLKDYEKFRTAFYEKGDREKYYLQELFAIDGMCRMPKLRMNGTTFIEEKYKTYNMHHGIYIDIFILHSAPRKFHKRINMFIANQYITIKELSKTRYTRKKILLIPLAILRLFPENFMRKVAFLNVYKYDSENSDMLFDNDVRSIKHCFYLKKNIFPAKDVLFEGFYLKGPADIDSYLRGIYGDYMAIPSLDSILSQQHAYKWNHEVDFHCYLPWISDYSDEKV